MLEPINSLDDPRVAAYRNLRDRTLRGESIFLAEGSVLVRRLLESRYATESVLVEEPYAEEFQQLVGDRVPVYVARKELLLKIVGYPFHRGALAVGRRPEPRTLEEVLEAQVPKQGPDRLRLVVLPEVTKPENLGLTFRAAAAFGIEAILLGPRSCDPLSRRAMRVSMGGVLTVPFARSVDLKRDLSTLKTAWGVELSAAVLDKDAPPLAEARWPTRAAVVFGNEFHGLAAEIGLLCDRRYTIPMAPGTDSLNLGVAAGIFLYEMTRQFRGQNT
jgi:tRNA G18 (ribose-2'-O)-methylase SpoU